MFSFATPRPRRRPSLTPMIDVVFLLLVFFMLASQFGREAALPLSAGGSGTDYSGPPRLIEIAAEGLTLNGAPVAQDGLAGALADLTATPDDIIVLRSEAGVNLQRLIDVTDSLRAAGFGSLAIVE
ncbi:ExbD/TolR family protein [Thalassovita aquimarina]|uniref:ExbD/TolR family protein n=1 Tax=Thalassovita aquimarina TaxID=2785917 RepID=UPI00356275A2